MKKTNLKKLTLRKNVIASFDAAGMNQVVGGADQQTDRCFITVATRTLCPDSLRCYAPPAHTAGPEC